MNEVCDGTQTVLIIAIAVDSILVPTTYHAVTKKMIMMIQQPSPTVKADIPATVTSTKDHSPHEGVGWRKKVYQTN